MNDDLAFIAIIVAPFAGLAFLAGYCWPRHPWLAGLGVTMLLAGALVVAGRAGLSATAPYAVMVALLAILPAIVAASLGARIRRGRRG